MGAHMLDLVAEYVGTADVSLTALPSHRAGWLLDRAAPLGARTLPLPSPRDPRIRPVITEFLRAHPADIFHCHVGTGNGNWDGVRLARAAVWRRPCDSTSGVARELSRRPADAPVQRRLAYLHQSAQGHTATHCPMP
jgi:hypothetical protein